MDVWPDVCPEPRNYLITLFLSYISGNPTPGSRDLVANSVWIWPPACTQFSFKGCPFNSTQLAYGPFQLMHVMWQPCYPSRVRMATRRETTSAMVCKQPCLVCDSAGTILVSCPDPTHKGRGSGYTSPISWASGSAEAL